MAIPAYQKYQKSAKEGVALGSINQIKKAWAACIAVNSYTTCNTSGIDGTIQQQPGAMIGHNSGSMGVCWLVTVDTAKACVDFDDASPFGVVMSTSANVASSCATGEICKGTAACNTTTGVCTP